MGLELHKGRSCVEEILNLTRGRNLARVGTRPAGSSQPRVLRSIGQALPKGLSPDALKTATET